jgi:hypothetical protein
MANCKAERRESRVMERLGMVFLRAFYPDLAPCDPGVNNSDNCAGCPAAEAFSRRSFLWIAAALLQEKNISYAK